MSRFLSLRTAAFPLFAAGVLVAAASIAARLGTLGQPELLAAALVLDLVLTVPLVFYLLVARPRAWSPVTALPVAILGYAAARWMLPVEHRAALGVAELVLVPAEFAVLATIAWRARRALAVGRSVARQGSTDPLAQLRAAARDLVPNTRVAEVLTTELAVLYYGLAAWRAQPHVPAGFRAVETHRRSNHGAFLVAVLLLALAEGVAVHLLLNLWSSTAAWIVTALGLYTCLWLVADYRATVLRPWLVGDGELHVRAGLRWHATLPLGAVEAIADGPAPSTAALSTAFLATPTRWILLREPWTVAGPYGFRKRVRAIGLVPDAKDALRDLAEPSEPEEDAPGTC